MVVFEAWRNARKRRNINWSWTDRLVHWSIDVRMWWCQSVVFRVVFCNGRIFFLCVVIQNRIETKLVLTDPQVWSMVCVSLCWQLSRQTERITWIKIENTILAINTTTASYFTNKFEYNNNLCWEPKLAITYFIHWSSWLLTLALNEDYLVVTQVIKL